MGTIAQIRAALKASASSFTDANRFDFEPKNPAGNRVIVSWPDTLDPHPTFGDTVDYVIPVRFEVPWIDDESGDDKLMAYMYAARDALEATVVTGVCDSVACLPFTEIGARRLNDESMVMQFTVPVSVYA